MGDQRVDDGAFGLSERQVEVLKAVARVGNSRAAAASLNLSEATVKRHLANIYERMGVASRLEAVGAGVRIGLLSPSELWETPGEDDAVRFRCRRAGCGREVVLVRESADPHARDTAPWCHGEEMVRVGNDAPSGEYRRARFSSPTIRAELPRTSSTRTSENNPSTHSDEQSS
jgi:DNA-binding CsgD family transcriptional regulator